MGDVIGDLNSRRGLVGEFLDKPGNMRVGASSHARASQAGPGLLSASGVSLYCIEGSECPQACMDKVAGVLVSWRK